MRKHLLSILAFALLAGASHAQTVSDFEALSLSSSDTFYVNYNTPMSDVGFTNGNAFFSCYYDTSYGGFWSSGFAYTNKTDSVTSGYGNQYSAKAASGYAGSLKYAAANAGGTGIKIHLSGASKGQTVQGFYVTNSTYAYNSMRDGDQFASKFGYSHGDTTGNFPDWFKLTVVGYHGGAMTSNSVDFYLADYRTANKILIKDWQWVNLTSLGNVDSLQLSLSSSDTAFGFMNTPAFFCIDNFTANDSTSGVNSVKPAAIAKVYPNPAKDVLTIETSPDLSKGEELQATVLSISGQKIFDGVVKDGKLVINTSTFSAGVYMLQLSGDKGNACVRFVKQ